MNLYAYMNNNHLNLIWIVSPYFHFFFFSLSLLISLSLVIVILLFLSISLYLSLSLALFYSFIIYLFIYLLHIENYLEQDRDGDGLLSCDELLNYAGGSYTPTFITRIFQVFHTFQEKLVWLTYYRLLYI